MIAALLVTTSRTVLKQAKLFKLESTIKKQDFKGAWLVVYGPDISIFRLGTIHMTTCV